MFSITFYRNYAEPNRVDKSDYLYHITTLQGTLRNECSITDPIITIEYNPEEQFLEYNYAYIPQFKRYYYITDISHLRTGLLEITMSVDILMSFKEAILRSKGFVERNEFQTNPLLIDKKRVIEQGVETEQYVTNNSLLDTVPSFIVQGFALQLEETE